LCTDKLLFALHGISHIIPLSIAFDRGSNQFFFEQFELRYIANTGTAYALYRQQHISKPLKPEGGILSVAHTGGSHNKLKYPLKEAKEISHLFECRTELYEDQATPQEVIQQIKRVPYSNIHFSCHGNFNPLDPDLSGLSINGRLTVEMILTQCRLRYPSVVVMSACQTARTQFGLSDDLNGLSQAWLIAGASKIVSSLWSVDDKSTMLLFKEFYLAMQQPGANEALALRSAMQSIKGHPNYQNVFYWGAFQLLGIN
jgi:CHAT domain-containing protein